MERFLTMTEYARERAVSHEAVRKAVREGRLRSNGKRGRECRVIVEDDPDGEAAPKDSNSEAYKKYLAARCRKVKADAKLAELQEETRIREIRSAAITEFLDSLDAVFIDARRKLEQLPNADAVSQILVEMMNEIQANIPE